MARTPINRLHRIGAGWNAVFTVLLAAAALAVIAPILLVLIISFSSQASITRWGYTFFPGEWSLEGYRFLFKTGTQLVNSYVVTVAHAISGTALSLAAMTLFAYVISQKKFRLRRFLTWMLFFTMLFNGGLVPSYVLAVRYLHINNTFWIFILPNLVSAYYVVILRTFLKTAVPESLYEAARIDGAGHLRIYASIVMPLFKTGVATIALFSLVGRWNDWFTGMLYNDKPALIPLQTMLYKLQESIDFIKQNAAIAGTPDGVALIRTLPDENLRMACTVIVVLPILFAYPFFQRYFVRGLTVGSIKE